MTLFTQVARYLSLTYPASLRLLPPPLVKHMFRVLFREDYTNNFMTLIPYLQAEATHFTIDKSLIGNLREGYWGWDFVFDCSTWKKLTTLSLRNVGHLTLKLPKGLEELYLHNRNCHVLPSCSAYQRVVVDWDDDDDDDHHLNIQPYYPDDICCEEFLIKRTDSHLLILLFNRGYAYVGPVMYRPPEAFSIFGWHDASPPPPPAVVSMEKFVEGIPSKYGCPILHYETTDENEPLIKACLERMLWDARHYQDAYWIIVALNDIEMGRQFGPEYVDTLKGHFSRIDLATEEARMWRDRISQCLTDFNYYLDEGYESTSESEDMDYWDYDYSDDDLEGDLEML